MCVMFSAVWSGHVAGDRASQGVYRGPKLETRYRSKKPRRGKPPAGPSQMASNNPVGTRVVFRRVREYYRPPSRSVFSYGLYRLLGYPLPLPGLGPKGDYSSYYCTVPGNVIHYTRSRDDIDQ